MPNNSKRIGNIISINMRSWKQNKWGSTLRKNEYLKYATLRNYCLQNNYPLPIKAKTHYAYCI